MHDLQVLNITVASRIVVLTRTCQEHASTGLSVDHLWQRFCFPIFCFRRRELSLDLWVCLAYKIDVDVSFFKYWQTRTLVAALRHPRRMKTLSVYHKSSMCLKHPDGCTTIFSASLRQSRTTGVLQVSIQAVLLFQCCVALCTYELMNGCWCRVAIFSSRVS